MVVGGTGAAWPTRPPARCGGAATGRACSSPERACSRTSAASSSATTPTAARASCGIWRATLRSARSPESAWLAPTGSRRRSASSTGASSSPYTWRRGVRRGSSAPPRRSIDGGGLRRAGLRVADNSLMYGLDAATGRVGFRVRSGGTSAGSPMLAGDTVIALGHTEGALEMTAVDAGSGRPRFTTALQIDSAGRPLAWRGRFVIPGLSGREAVALAYDASGQELFRQPLGAEGLPSSPPAGRGCSARCATAAWSAWEAPGPFVSAGPPARTRAAEGHRAAGAPRRAPRPGRAGPRSRSAARRPPL